MLGRCGFAGRKMISASTGRVNKVVNRLLIFVLNGRRWSQEAPSRFILIPGSLNRRERNLERCNLRLHQIAGFAHLKLFDFVSYFVTLQISILPIGYCSLLDSSYSLAPLVSALLKG